MKSTGLTTLSDSKVRNFSKFRLCFNAYANLFLVIERTVKAAVVEID